MFSQRIIQMSSQCAMWLCVWTSEFCPCLVLLYRPEPRQSASALTPPGPWLKTAHPPGHKMNCFPRLIQKGISINWQLGCSICIRKKLSSCAGRIAPVEMGAAVNSEVGRRNGPPSVWMPTMGLPPQQHGQQMTFFFACLLAKFHTIPWDVTPTQTRSPSAYLIIPVKMRNKNTTTARRYRSRTLLDSHQDCDCVQLFWCVAVCDKKTWKSILIAGASEW